MKSTFYAWRMVILNDEQPVQRSFEGNWSLKAYFCGECTVIVNSFYVYYIYVAVCYIYYVSID